MNPITCIDLSVSGEVANDKYHLRPFATVFVHRGDENVVPHHIKSAASFARVQRAQLCLLKREASHV